MAYANENRNWCIYADFAQVLIYIARELYRNDDFGVELDETVYALDTSTIDLCLSLFPWARFRKTKGAIKLHTLLDLRGSIQSFISITQGTVHDVNVLGELDNLQAEGITTADIDAVVLTHGHPDHIGGNTDAQGKPAFPNARYFLREPEAGDRLWPPGCEGREALPYPGSPFPNAYQ